MTMTSPVRLLCWDRPPSRRLQWLADRAANQLASEYGPLSRFWVWVERTDGGRGFSHGGSDRPARFRVRLVVELAIPPAPLRPVTRTESAAGTPEAAFRRIYKDLRASLQAQRTPPPLPPFAPQNAIAPAAPPAH